MTIHDQFCRCRGCKPGLAPKPIAVEEKGSAAGFIIWISCIAIAVIAVVLVAYTHS